MCVCIVNPTILSILVSAPACESTRDEIAAGGGGGGVGPMVAIAIATHTPESRNANSAT